MRRALGKGLSQLLDDQCDSTSNEVAVSSIVANPRQPRRLFDNDALEELAASIKEHGVLQPLVVRNLAPNRYELIAGERRLRAARLAGLKEVPVVVRTANAQKSLELALVENVQRRDINPIECAFAYKKLSDEFGLTQDQIAQKVGKSRVAVANAVRLLKLPEDVQQAIQEGHLSEGHARALLMVDSPMKLRTLFEATLRDGVSVRELERLARGEPRTPKGGPQHKGQPVLDPDWFSIQTRVSEHLGAKVQLDKKSSGGRLSVEFYSEDELEGLLEKMGLRL